MNVLPFINRLSDAGVGVQGESLFAYMMPAEASSAVMVRTDLNGAKINHQLPGYFKTRVQVIARDTSYQAADARMSAALTALTLEEGAVLEDATTRMTFNFCRPVSLPAAFPLSTGNLIEFNVFMEVCFVLETINAG